MIVCLESARTDRRRSNINIRSYLPLFTYTYCQATLVVIPLAMDDDDEQLAGPSKTRPVFSYTSPSAQQEQEEETDQQAFEEAVMADDGDEDEDGEAIGHMQEVIPGLWIGDIIAARDGKGLKEAGIVCIQTFLQSQEPSNSFITFYSLHSSSIFSPLHFPSQNTIVSILKHEVKYPFAVKSYSLPVDDVASSDILSHIPACVAWIQAAMEESRNREGENLEEGDGIDRAGGILVHCQAGMSKSLLTLSRAAMFNGANAACSEARSADLSPHSALFLQPHRSFRNHRRGLPHAHPFPHPRRSSRTHSFQASSHRTFSNLLGTIRDLLGCEL